MDQGVIKNLKTLYRKELIEMTLNHIEKGLLETNATACDVSSTINVLDAIMFVSRSWRAVKPSTVSKCFKKCGFIRPGRPPLCLMECDTEDPKDFSLPEEIVNGEVFNGIDDNIVCVELGELTEELPTSNIFVLRNFPMRCSDNRPLRIIGHNSVSPKSGRLTGVDCMSKYQISQQAQQCQMHKQCQ
ncbi:hypothetical protein V1264_003475 [Littorina saxatilis]|uniref:DDE-1 domain-containing protein n=1 Tax=Littorina saxatilis TaxID=31220 RepID=A0AAN9B7H7_9CAEN